MRRSRRNGHAGLEFGGSGEDSFVAVVVTKLTGALLFILLLTMVIMALLPKAVDLPSSGPSGPKAQVDPAPLAIATPEMLPEAIAGRPYVVALAATGGRGPLRWSVDGPIPDGLRFDPDTAQLKGTPRQGTPEPVALVLRVSDGTERATQPARLVVYRSDRPLSTPSKWKPGLPPIPWRAWLEQGFGFLVLWLVHLVSMNTLGGLERWSLGRATDTDSDADTGSDRRAGIRRRFAAYRAVVRLASLAAAAGLALWLWRPRG
ncbi:MAG TPA: putative Ig domain-containing protein [Isosphaeraceae bacterium]|nr:putative Ig domain-containing protein [Isosphaeraceae bacterium]